MALLDTGASVNVLPYDIGLQLGVVWEEQTVPIQLSGNLVGSVIHVMTRRLVAT